MSEHRAINKDLTVGLIILGVGLMAVSPVSSSPFLTGILFFGGAATALTALAAKVKHGFTQSVLAQAAQEHDILSPDPEVISKPTTLDGLELTAADLKFLAKANLAG